MLGSINTGGFSKSQVDAMKDSNYFNRKGVLGVYDPPNPKAPVVTGSFLDDDDDDAKGFLDAFLEGIYLGFVRIRDGILFLSKNIQNWQKLAKLTKNDKKSSKMSQY